MGNEQWKYINEFIGKYETGDLIFASAVKKVFGIRSAYTIDQMLFKGMIEYAAAYSCPRCRRTAVLTGADQECYCTYCRDEFEPTDDTKESCYRVTGKGRD